MTSNLQRTIAAMTLSVLLGSTAALAQQPAGPAPAPGQEVGVAPPPAAQPPAVPTTTAPGKSECKPVLFTRDAVAGKLNEFDITVSPVDIAVLKDCNNDNKAVKTISASDIGPKIFVSYPEGGVTIKLPTNMTEGVASNGRCFGDVTGTKVDAAIYKATWKNGLPERVDLKPLDETFFNKPAMVKICEGLQAASKYR